MHCSSRAYAVCVKARGIAARRILAPNYGIKRFTQHVENFDILTDIAERLAEDSSYLRKLNEVQKFELKNIELHDAVFPDIDLNWWNC